MTVKAKRKQHTSSAK